jgi:hypothetical protein
MADSHLSLAQKFVDATITTRKETSAIEDITTSIVARYKELTGSLGVIGKLFQSRIDKLVIENVHDRLAQKSIQDQLVKRQALNGTYNVQLQQIQKIQDVLKRSDIGAKKRSRLELELESAMKQAEVFSDELEKVSQNIETMTKFSIPAGKALDVMARAQKSWTDNIGYRMLSRSLEMSGEFNRSLINANSDLATRNKLQEAGFRVAVATGARTKTMDEAQRALVDIGLDLNDAYEDTLKTTVRLIDGLGMSADQAASLSITARSTNTQFRDMSNIISGIVDKTALAANEAARYARELSVAARVASGPTNKLSSASYTQNLQVVSQVEGALKGTIAVQGEIAAMMTKFSSFQKQGGMGLFMGTGGVDFLAKDEAAARRVMTNIAKSVKNSNSVMLEMQADMYGTSAETLRALGDLYNEQGAKIFEISPEMKERQNLERRYREQLALENQALRLLGDKLLYLTTGVLSPLIRIANAVSDRIIWMADKFSDFKIIAIPAMILVTATVVSSVARMSLALYKFALSTIALTTALNARFGAGAGSAAGGVVKNVATTVGAEAAGGLLTNLFKRGVVKAGAESIGGTVVKGMFARIFGGIATFFGGAALRSLLGRGLAMLVGACATGGWSLIIGLVVTLIGQFWPNIVSMVKGKGWSINQVGIGATGPKGESQFAMLIPSLAENIANAVATKDHSKINDAIFTAWQRARLRGTTETDIEAFKVEANRLMNMQVQGFIGYAQRRQAVDPSTVADNLEALNSIKTAVDLVNVTMTRMVDQNKKDIEDAKKREDADKVREERQRVSDMSRLPLPSPVMQGF